MTAPLREQLAEACSAIFTFEPQIAWADKLPSTQEFFRDRADRIIAAVPIIGAAEDMRDTAGILAELGPESVEYGDWPELRKAVRNVRAAIAKATPE